MWMRHRCSWRILTLFRNNLAWAMSMKRSFVYLVAFFLLAAGVFGLWFLRERLAGPGVGLPNGPPGGFAIPVEAAPVRVGELAEEITSIGTIRSNESVLVRPEIVGRVVRFNFQEGQRVSRDQMLVQLDDVVARAELSQAEAALELARANAARAEDLFARGAGPARARDEAVAALRSAEASVVLSRARLDKTVLVAPFDGIAGLRLVSPGAFVNAGQDIVNLESIDPVKVDFRVPELFLPVLQVGQKLDLRLDTFPGQIFSGEVYAIDPAVDVGGRSVAIRARIANADGALRPGLFARVTLVVRELHDAITVPETAIVSLGGQVLVVKVVDGRAQPQPVRLGLRREGFVQVMDGLTPGDIVVTAGQMKLQPGAQVRIIPPAAASSPVGAAPGRGTPAPVAVSDPVLPAAAAPTSHSGN